MSIIQRVPWTVQPQAPRINTNSPFFTGLVSLVWCGDGMPRDLLAPSIAYSKFGAASLTPSTKGLGWNSTGGAVGIAAGRNAATNCKVAATPMSFMVLGEIMPYGSSAAYTGYLGSAYDAYALASLYGTRARRARINIGGVAKNVDSGTWSTGVILAGLVADGTNLIGYDNGVAFGSVAASGSITYDATYGRMSIFGNSDYASVSGTVLYSATWNRALTAMEVAALTNMPWQIFVPLPRRIWAPSAGSGAQNLTPSLVTNTSSFYAATITTGTVALAPTLAVNTNAFYAPTVVTGAVDLTPGLLTNTNSFYSPSVSVGTVNLTSSLFTNTNSFYAHVVSLASGPQTLLPDLFSNSNSFYSASVITGSVDLTPLLFTNSNSFYSPTVSLGGVSLLPALFSNTNSFYAPAVSPGLVNLVAALFTNSNTFYGHTVTQPSLQDLIPSLYSNSQTFYTHSISAGTTLSPVDLLAIADAVWAHPRALTVDKFLGLK